MMTYLSLWLSSEGAEPMELRERLGKIEFKAVQGNYDFSYAWPEQPSVEDLLRLGNAVQRSLKGTKTLFKMESV